MALALGARNRGFNSLTPDQIYSLYLGVMKPVHKIGATIAAAAAMVGVALIAPKGGVLDGCPVKGDNSRTSIQALDLLKNRTADPQETLDLSFDQMAGAKVGDFTASESGTLHGYLVSAKISGPESCECHLTDPAAEDYHLYIGQTPNAPKNQCIICEVTGRKRVVDFSAVQSMVGKKVAITGWTFNDTEHRANSQADNPKGGNNWRASCKEIHPVTAMKVEG